MKIEVGESWRKAWKGSKCPIKPYEDDEWVSLRGDWLRSLPGGEGMSDEVAAHNYRVVQAQWMLDHVDELEEVDPDAAAELRRIR